MTSLAQTPAAYETAPPAPAATEADARARLKLVPSGDGWSLVTPGGRLVFQALGTRARRECLEYAQSTGVLAIYS